MNARMLNRRCDVAIFASQRIAATPTHLLTCDDDILVGEHASIAFEFNHKIIS